ILFNDFLLLTTPDEHLSKPNSFKISKTTDMNLTLYKQPMLLANLKVLPSNDETTLNIKHGMDTVSFKCVSSNARRLWTSQLEQAIDLYAITASEQEQARVSCLLGERNSGTHVDGIFRRFLYGKMTIRFSTIGCVPLCQDFAPQHVASEAVRT
ncbi:hypothetical protein GCK32_020360, partial [Trichostrongylus colubriformis]